MEGSREMVWRLMAMDQERKDEGLDSGSGAHGGGRQRGEGNVGSFPVGGTKL